MPRSFFALSRIVPLGTFAVICGDPGMDLMWPKLCQRLRGPISGMARMEGILRRVPRWSRTSVKRDNPRDSIKFAILQTNIGRNLPRQSRFYSTRGSWGVCNSHWFCLSVCVVGIAVTDNPMTRVVCFDCFDLRRLGRGVATTIFQGQQSAC